MNRGFSIAESIVALAVGSIAVAGGMSLNEQEMRLLKTSREASAAFQALEERVEQLRIATWRQITDPDYLISNYMPVTPKSVAALGNFTERVQVTAYPDPSVSAGLLVERQKGYSAVVVQDVGEGAAISEQKLAKVSVQIRWTGKGDRERVQELATIISNAGISRMNLAAMGTSGSGPTSESTAADAGTTASGTTTTTTGTSTTTTGNGNGQGNVGGKSGKK